MQVGSELPTCTRHTHLHRVTAARDCMKQFVSPDDEHDVLETCRGKNKNKCIERNLGVTLVVYQEALHDARSTKCKILCAVPPHLHSMLSNLVMQNI